MVERIAIEIRVGRTEDASAISALVVSFQHQYLVGSPADAARFLSAVAPQAECDNLRSQDHSYLVALAGGRVVGVIAVRGSSHVFRLFVAADCQRRGVARALWDRLRAEAPHITRYTVNSSVMAEPVYQRFGFARTASPTEADGIAFVPMAWEAPQGEGDQP
ncbi:MAG: GNAT family N-acetyltransferase [Pseudomonadota bacterium]